ncbi:MAG: DNA-binding response regulator [Halobacteriovorax sp.]|nr:DNA-binding response regulator [Halobacteriovorax sp.]|tara:strand:- start:467 stop:1177 length:711 start_codon:yes stop_codon:yes gene_type:complete
MAKIFLVEDEEHICDILNFQLKKAEHEVLVFKDGQEAIEALQSFDSGNPIDLFILDRMLPGANGVDICRFIRMYKPTQNIPILFLTALSKPEDIVLGLDAGADDYLTKPFESQVLLARVRSLLRRSVQARLSPTKQTTHILNNGPIKLDTDQCKVWIETSEVELTLSEFKLLNTFMANAGKVFTRNQLVEAIQDGPVHVTDRTIDTHIFGLRKKLGEQAALVETIRGVGYRVRPSE